VPFTFLRVLQAKKRADERTRTADLLQLRVRCGEFAGVHYGSQTRISKLISPSAYAGERTRICLHWCTTGVLTARNPKCLEG
jgi:hypothetical protein